MKSWLKIAALAAVLTTTAEARTLLNGAGATFPYPIYSKWFDVYHQQNPEIEINYQSIGSGGGIRQISEQTVDFGATDGPMTDDQLKKAPGKILHFPTVLGAVVPIYNIPGMSQELKFTGEVLASIFRGKILQWNDPALAELNPGVNLPDSSIVVVHRSDGSGTTYCWTDYLSKVSIMWASKVGKNTSVNWPVGLGAKGNEGVAGMTKQTPGAIGYVELIYATQNKLAYGMVKNRAGKFVRADLASVTAAASGAAKKMPADFRVSITNALGDDTYPISTFTWLLVYEKPSDAQKGKILTDFMQWMLKDGQTHAEKLGYAPLPAEVVKMEMKVLEKM